MTIVLPSSTNPIQTDLKWYVLSKVRGYPLYVIGSERGLLAMITEEHMRGNPEIFPDLQRVVHHQDGTVGIRLRPRALLQYNIIIREHRIVGPYGTFDIHATFHRPTGMWHVAGGPKIVELARG